MCRIDPEKDGIPMINPYDSVEIEHDIPFSKSMLWDAQRAFFAEHGVNAWDHQVPFYITSNPYIAKCYAKIIIRYIQDMYQHNKLDTKEPIYIFELGSGSGKFSFYIIKYLFFYQKALHLHTLDIRYVMTDFTQANIDFWGKHAGFSSYLDKQQLDFAIYDIENDEEIFLQKSQTKLTTGSIKNPATIIANYVFDTVKHDIFNVSHGQLNATHISTFTQHNNFRNNKLSKLENINNSFINHEITENHYYNNPKIDAALMQYKHQIKDSTFLFPIGTLKFLESFRKLIKNDFMVISTDKSYAHLNELENLAPPSIAFHGSFSMMVNLHAIGCYFQNLGGFVKHQSIRDGIKTSVFILGTTVEDLPETRLAIEENVEQFSPADFFNLYQFLKSDSITPKAIAAEMQMVGWDPYIFSAQVRKLLPVIDEMSNPLKQYFINHMPLLCSNFYHMPGESDAYFDLGIFLQSVKLYREAAHYFQLSLNYYGENFATYYNLGLCHYYANQFENAVHYLQKAEPLEQNTTQARDLLAEIARKNT